MRPPLLVLRTMPVWAVMSAGAKPAAVLGEPETEYTLYVAALPGAMLSGSTNETAQEARLLSWLHFEQLSSWVLITVAPSAARSWILLPAGTSPVANGRSMVTGWFETALVLPL